MLKPSVTDIDVASIEKWIADHAELAHVRARRRGDLVTFESGSARSVVRHARLRRVTARLWTVEVPLGARWQSTGVRAPRDVLLGQLLKNTSWMLSPAD